MKKYTNHCDTCHKTTLDEKPKTKCECGSEEIWVNTLDDVYVDTIQDLLKQCIIH